MKLIFKICTSGLLFLSLNGCMTFSGDNLAEIAPITPITSPSIEISVGDFTSHIEGDNLVKDNKAGRVINDEIMENWKDNKYISDFTYAKNEITSSNVQYSLILRGHQQDTASTLMQFISAITFLLIPATTETSYDLIYELEELKTGKKYTAKVADTISTTTWLIYFPALPFSSIGANKTFERIAEHAYQDFVNQGAFLN